MITENKVKTAFAAICVSLLVGTPISAYAGDSSDLQKAKHESVKMSQKTANNPYASELQELIVSSTSAYASISGTESHRKIAKSADCVIVFPKVTSAALLVGAATSDGIATCRTSDNSWSDPAFVDFTAASFGAQLGAKTTKMVFYLMNEKSRKSLANGEFALGADLSYAWGEKDAELQVNTAGKDVIIFAESKGRYAGASLGGAVIDVDENAIKQVYGNMKTADAVLQGRQLSDRDVVSDFHDKLG